MQGEAARLLRERRDALGLTQHQVAQRAGVREYDVSRWERGRVRGLPLLGVYLVCRALGIDITDVAEAMIRDAASDHPRERDALVDEQARAGEWRTEAPRPKRGRRESIRRPPS